MNKIGVIVRDLGFSQSNFSLIKSLNYFVDNNLTDCCIFYESLVQTPLTPLFGTYHVNEIYDFEGIVISTNLLGTKRLVNVPGPLKKYFYIWDLEWTKLRGYQYNIIRDIYLNSEVDLIARSERHYNLLKNCFKKPACIIDNWEKEELAKLCTT